MVRQARASKVLVKEHLQALHTQQRADAVVPSRAGAGGGEGNTRGRSAALQPGDPSHRCGCRCRPANSLVIFS